MKLFLLTVFIVPYIRKGVAECGGFQITASGWISAPRNGTDLLYINNADCVWFIEAYTNQAIQIQFMEMDIEEEMVCEYDYLKIDDGLTPKIYHCGSDLPQDFISDTRLAVVRFISDGSIRRSGFKLTYNLIEDPTCGYRTWRTAGRFGSFDTYTEPGMCTWAIQGPRRYVALKVFVTKLNIPLSIDCVLQYIEIYDDYEIFDRYCGVDTITVITTTENVLYVDFKSSGITSSLLFEIYYTHADLNGKCGDIMTKPAGNISSYDGDNDGFYDNNQDCVWTIIAPEDKVIRLEFHTFDLEAVSGCEYDYVRVYDGPFEDWAILATYCGYDLPPVLWTTSNILTVHFQSDQAFGLRGFNASYTHEEERTQGYNETLTQPSGVIHSPDQDNNGRYEALRDCLWTIIASEDQVIYLQFLFFDLELSWNCNFDFVEVFDGGFEEEHSLGKYCGDILPPVIWSTSNILMVHFVSDAVIHGLGFNITYKVYNASDRITTSGSFPTLDSLTTMGTTAGMVESTTIWIDNTTENGSECIQFLNRPSGFIHSPDADNDGEYDRNQTCSWTLTAPDGDIIYLHFLEFDIEFYNNCIYDFVEIWEIFDSELERSAVSLGKYCGDTSPPVIWSTSNILAIHFYSDSWLTGGGFNATYKFYEAYLTECGGLLTEPSGFIHSPDVDNDGYYDSNQNCFWTITAPEGQVIFLKFLEFDIEFHVDCGYDFVEVFDGGFGIEADSRGKYCGSILPPALWTTTNILGVRFYSDLGVTVVGFNAAYRFYNVTDRDSFTVGDTTEKMVESTAEFQTECGENLTQPSGYIHSPDHDNDGKYETNQDCYWTLTALEHQVIYLKFQYFFLEDEENCDYDYVEIKEVSAGEFGGSVSNIGKYCGISGPSPIWSTTNVLLLHFHSDDYVTEAGFNATYRHYNETDTEPKKGTLFLLLSQGNSSKTYYDRLLALNERIFPATDRDSFTTESSETTTTTESQNSCEQLLTEPSGYIHSPDEDNDGNYELNQDCFWRISAPEGHVISLKFLEFNLEYEENCDYDFVEIRQVVSVGEVEESVEIIGKHCGPVRPGDIWSTSNILVVHFHSDEYVNNAGFNATYRHYDVTDWDKFTTSWDGIQ